MDYKEKVEWLGRYQASVSCQHMLEEEIEVLRSDAERVTACMSGMPGRSGPNADRLPRAVERIEEAQKRLEQQLESCMETRAEIMCGIMTVRDRPGQEVLREVLPAPVKRSLAFLLLSISLWFIGYNGVTTWFTKYVEAVMGEGLGGASTCLLVATAGAIVSYIPIGALAAKIGRKRTIQCGIVLLATCFMLGYLLTTMYTSIQPIMYVVFALVGLAWAAINVNSLPMVVEMCRGSDIGKFTGYYYTFSMAAQVVTPIVAGSLMRAIDYRVLFPYAALFVALSFVTMCFVKHGDARAEAKKGLAAFEDMDS